MDTSLPSQQHTTRRHLPVQPLNQRDSLRATPDLTRLRKDKHHSARDERRSQLLRENRGFSDESDDVTVQDHRSRSRSSRRKGAAPPPPTDTPAPPPAASTAATATNSFSLSSSSLNNTLINMFQATEMNTGSGHALPDANTSIAEVSIDQGETFQTELMNRLNNLDKQRK
ncbi:Protein of unknown function [Gryllus bimaculatus]|nr:Protein of unknown function [Gryllus bimaculatus]